jgi:hypothetical protein
MASYTLKMKMQLGSFTSYNFVTRSSSACLLASSQGPGMGANGWGCEGEGRGQELGGWGQGSEGDGAVAACVQKDKVVVASEAQG